MKKKWTLEQIKDELFSLMKLYDLDKMPSRQFLEGVGRTDLFNAIARHGGFRKVASEFGLSNQSIDIRWTDCKIESELKVFIQEYSLSKMPSKPFLVRSGRSDLASAMTRKKTMNCWSEKLGLPMNESETSKGNACEFHIKRKIEQLSSRLLVEKMSTRHPYDLLINNCVKVDVKQGKAHYHYGSRAHTFGLSKKYPTCDIYVCVAMDENDNIEKYFIIPSQYAQVVTLNIGTKSKYNKYIDDWKFITHFVNQYEKAVMT